MAKTTDAKSLVEQLEGRREPLVPVYEFSGGRTRYERPGHNPFRDIELEDDNDNQD